MGFQCNITILIVMLFFLLTGYETLAARFDEREVPWNLNQNREAVDPLEYWGEWENHRFFPSPDDWRVPFYTIILDKWKDGDPTNNEANNTVYEYDIRETGFRSGGDIVGLKESLDYLVSMGIKVIYIAGTPFLNQPWGADQYSPLDFTILDHHSGTIEQWRDTIEEIHRRGLYLVLDLTVATLSDLVGFKKYLNTTTPFSLFEHEAVWKNVQTYPDWKFSNEYDPDCELPRFWGEDGVPVIIDYVGCYDSDFNQYGDTEAFGTHPDWQRQLSKFASVQDRLRDWKPSVSEKLKRFACIVISSLDVDGFRIDKATQITVDFLASWATSVRECAASYNKKNFFIPGEVTGSSSYGSIYYGQGRQPDQRPPSIWSSLNTSELLKENYLREPGNNALDASAFHYSVYRAITRFLLMDGDLQVPYDLPVEFTDLWNVMTINEDFFNPNTHSIDPRHLLGVTNHDVFRWPAIDDGTERLLLGTMVTYFLFPGIPSIYYGDEQGLYVLDNTADNYLYGRQAMPSSPAWKIHGCYTLLSDQYPNMPFTKALNGCTDDWNTLDHFDFAKPELQMLKIYNQIRDHYPAVKDGWKSTKISNWTSYTQLPCSGTIPTEIGVWSIVRGFLEPLQKASDYQKENTWNGDLWFLYTNENKSVTLDFPCSSSKAILSPYREGIVIKNLIYPYEEYNLVESNTYASQLKSYYGCIRRITLPAWGFKIFVPKDKFIKYLPRVTSFSPAHDSRLLNEEGRCKFQIRFSEEVDCDDVSKKISFVSKTETNNVIELDRSSVVCQKVNQSETEFYFGYPTAKYIWSGFLKNIHDGIHQVILPEVYSDDHKTKSDSLYRVTLRFGKPDNPMIFQNASRASDLLIENDEKLYIKHKAAGADLFRYSFDFGLTWSEWEPYQDSLTECTSFARNISKKTWDGHHVSVQYWSRLAASPNHMQEGSIGKLGSFPQLYMNGPYNEWGFDSGIPNKLKLNDDFTWRKTLISEVFPSKLQFNVYNVDEFGRPDQKRVYGSNGNSTVLSRLPPSELKESVILIHNPPPKSYLSWEVVIDDLSRRFTFVPKGSSTVSIILFVSFASTPMLCAVLTVWAFKTYFYKVRLTDGDQLKPVWKGKFFKPFKKADQVKAWQQSPIELETIPKSDSAKGKFLILVATLEYNIPDWQIKIKIGGLGVMAELMGKHLQHHNLLWVVPCVGNVEYPVEEEAEPLKVVVLDQIYQVKVYIHHLSNITYLLLEAPVFRKQTTSEPYPPRMDDLSSAIFYSAWNQCIAGIAKRYPIDLYHINDYHGALAPLYLLPKIIPCVMSLHNAEFQGLWPLRTSEEKSEVCAVYNLSIKICTKYVQFGNVFNLLHAGVSYIRIHQKGYGVVGVSNKYGKRSRDRYPIFWGLKKIGKLPNPDPADTASLDPKSEISDSIEIDEKCIESKKRNKREAQSWTGLKIDDSADLLVFVGRWSMQKGVDLIADIAPALLQDFNVQIITIGPIIDLYGKFAAEKLDFLMKKYPNRVYSRPEFTHLPPCIFSGADFVLIPSRDEPFGLVAVEFGRKGALGIGARVGGLGQMPGWWYSVESNTTSHTLQQFEEACRKALSSSELQRARMRAQSARQRFPVLEWTAKLDDLMKNSVVMSKKYRKVSEKPSKFGSRFAFPLQKSLSSLRLSNNESNESFIDEVNDEECISSSLNHQSDLNRMYSLGSKKGPGHRSTSNNEFLIGLSKTKDSENDEDSETSEPSYQPSMRVISEYSTPSEEPKNYEPEHWNGDIPLCQCCGRNDHSVYDSSSEDIHQSIILHNERYEKQNDSQLSLASVITSSGNKEFALTKTDDDFTDTNGKALEYFIQNLKDLTPKNSKDDLCIEMFITKMKKEWFDGIRNLRFGIQRPNLLLDDEDKQLLMNDPFNKITTVLDNLYNKELIIDYSSSVDLSINKTSRIKYFMQRRFGEWPVYSIFLSFGQVLAASSYQLILLSGSSAQYAEQLYIVGSIFAVSSVVWWYIYRKLPNIVCLTLPFGLYFLAFTLIGVSSFIQTSTAFRIWISYLAGWIYSVASASGSLYFSLNFGDEAGASVIAWIIRACIVQGLQQVWASCLWYWGSKIDRLLQDHRLFPHDVYPLGAVAAVAWPLAILMLICGLLLIFGLPDYYWQSPGNIPAFYTALLRRKLVLWFLIATVVQNYWLSTLYGRSWKYLWGSSIIAPWKILIFSFSFFTMLWVSTMILLGWKSRTHTWLLPVFGIGLGSPRWLQMMWGTSNIGVYLPWSGSASPIVGRLLWLWLGVLDCIQGVGIGMILLQTLTRRHLATTLIAGQIVGTITSMIARATAPNRIGPSSVFLDFTSWQFEDGMKIFRNVPFWVCLLSQVIVSAGYLLFFRRENLSRP
ncbi:alpha-1,3-glucan synthase Mok13 [Schizosaccharomyces cryophilus OY26]|uniref:alpha-1,3-glucan synthase n=1 Tax=Schizosaccharomyces cryophilus (strain OY26 / ATCC MYA-4695 / CBS 11777 / NBRC 106824 / NRRL Y48691) TaxID=653667 RepID=S9XJC4_SCHCR|nr:alpha-1,3-glucan synthase Mok13 [Schizosaccharomyces cryophilus OY26]EPY53741.1 alpha-1,3-glucan synthase Mok13 [Schizosaccharomyces cryophilus OY26]